LNRIVTKRWPIRMLRFFGDALVTPVVRDHKQKNRRVAPGRPQPRAFLSQNCAGDPTADESATVVSVSRSTTSSR